jgi:4-alpha-glucanotransferase
VSGQKPNCISFILALHNHQPEGNLPEVFDRAFASAYEPFIRELESFPEMKVTLHYSGILLNWLRENRPQFMSRLRGLIANGQVEMMGGAFYEPILTMIPDEDKIGQIKKLSSFIRDNFGVEAVGAWVAERVWEPHLALSLAEAGILYTVLDDAHFHNVGFSEEDTLHYYRTEEAGARLSVFPISEKMRYLIPFAQPQETIDYLRQTATPEGDRVVVLADDGEKFGSWPDTAAHVYGQGWLRRFFALLQENSDWVHVTTFSDFIGRFPPAGRVYLPAASYREMMEWSGGFWRNFFVRYPESNQIHKKMLNVREKLIDLPDSKSKQEALDYIWAGQCNCAYWHGVFGGLYLNFLRSALYSRLIAAEKIIDSERHLDTGWVELERKDFDYDGNEEILVSGPDLGLILAPSQGGAMLELDFKPLSFNLMDVLTRRPEPYHCDIFELAEGQCATEEIKTIHHITRVKEAGLENLLVYDTYRRASLVDHFFVNGATLDDFSSSFERVEEGDFVGRPYYVEETSANGKARVVMSREGLVGRGLRACTVRITKTVEYEPQTGVINYQYVIVNTGDVPLDSNFAVEFNINFLAGNAADRYYSLPGKELDDRLLNSRGEVSEVWEFGLVDEWKGITTEFVFDRPANMWRLPLETVSQSEDGMERVYQGSSVFPRWQVRLEPAQSWHVNFTQKVRELGRDVN